MKLKEKITVAILVSIIVGGSSILSSIERQGVPAPTAAPAAGPSIPVPTVAPAPTAKAVAWGVMADGTVIQKGSPTTYGGVVLVVLDKTRYELTAETPVFEDFEDVGRVIIFDRDGKCAGSITNGLIGAHKFNANRLCGE
jgi:hypothetical protein